MLKKRIIPCLDIKDGQTVKGVQFEGLRFAGDPIELAKKYVLQGADELVFLDITATIEKRATLVELVKRIAAEINIPFTVGGGIATVEDAAACIAAGADKVAINSAAVRRPELISDIASRFGSQCVVLAMDVKPFDGEWKVVIQSGKEPTEWSAVNWAKEVEKLGAGEILLTSMLGDGSKKGFSLAFTEVIASAVSIPVIASGGAGSANDFYELFSQTQASAGLAASLFHFDELSIPDLKNDLKNKNIAIR
ncbi:MAG: imidazole glycerol phosphate synthase subunit HisF [Bacteroidetes bacterium]|nr:imidazole glycerol phosphate synthase subunit HisF [Bacteroidota bacterium]